MSPARSLAVAACGVAAALAAAGAIWRGAPEGARPLALLPVAAAGGAFLVFVLRLVKPARTGDEERS